MYKIAVMGDHDSIYGYGALGLDIYPVSDPEEAAKILHRLSLADTAVVYMTEALAAALGEEIDRYKGAMLPAVILIPGISGNTGQGIADVRRSVERAVGSDIIFNS